MKEYQKIIGSQFSNAIRLMEVNKVVGLILRIGIFVDLKHQLTKHSCSPCPEKTDKATASDKIKDI